MQSLQCAYWFRNASNANATFQRQRASILSAFPGTRASALLIIFWSNFASSCFVPSLVAFLTHSSGYYDEYNELFRASSNQLRKPTGDQWRLVYCKELRPGTVSSLQHVTRIKNHRYTTVVLSRANAWCAGAEGNAHIWYINICFRPCV